MVKGWLRAALAPGYTLALALVVGGQAAIGYVAAPAIFALLSERALAGTVAGEIFARMGWISLGGLTTLVLLRAALERAAARSYVDALSRARWELLMLLLTALGHLWIRPWIAGVRALIQQQGGFLLCDPALRTRFGMLHGVSSMLFLGVVLCGIGLLLRLRPPAPSIAPA